jgi:uncharacterized membrane protein YfcA
MKTRGKRTDTYAIPPLIAWFALFFAIWAFALNSESHSSVLWEHWRLWLGVVVRSMAGSVMPISAGAVSGPLLLTDGQTTVSAARNLAFALQAVGLTSAATLIISRRADVDWRTLGWAAVGCLIGTPLGMVAWGSSREIAEALSLYVILWGGFGLAVLHWRKLINEGSDDPELCGRKAGLLALASGFVGGFGVSSILGAGVALPFYLVLVLLRRLSARTAINTSILLMALNSFLGLFFGMRSGGIDHVGFHVWLSVAPLACVAVPLGLLVVNRVPSRFILVAAGLLCVGQAAWLTEWILTQSGTLHALAVTLLAACVAASCRCLVWLGRTTRAI